MFNKPTILLPKKLNLEKRRLMLRKTFSITDYVTDGIGLWWDAIYNTPSGHNASSTIWEDLSGNGHNATYNANNIIGSNYLDVNGYGLQYVALSTNEKTALKSGMCEIVLDPENSISSVCAILTAFGNAGTVGSVYLKSGSVSFTAGTTAVSLVLQSGIHYYNSQLWVDGAVASNTSKKDSWATQTTYLGSYTGVTSYPFNGKIYAIRYYTRILTSAEMTQNWLVDKARFGIK